MVNSVEDAVEAKAQSAFSQTKFVLIYLPQAWDTNNILRFFFMARSGKLIII